MRARGAFVCGALIAGLAGGCGSIGHKSTTESTGAPQAGMSSHLLTNNELAGFTGGSPTIASTPASWVSDNGPPPNGVAAEEKRLTALGFVRGARVDLTGGSTNSTPGLSLVEQFGSPKEAQSEVDYQADQFKQTGAQGGARFKPFAVPGVPGARGYAAVASGGGGINVGFAKGTYAYVVGQELSSSDSYSGRVAKLIAAAQHLYASAPQ